MEDKILNLFLFKNSLKFNEIETLLKIRSNKLAYHLKKLIKNKVLLKKNENYYLNPEYEYLIPYLSDKNSVIVTLIIFIGNKNEAFLYKREKRPFKGKLALPGGRLLVGESINQGVKRIMNNKFNIKIDSIKIHSISLEHVKNDFNLVHSFFPIFISAKTKSKLHLTNIEKNKKNIILSDYKFIKEDINSNIKIRNIRSIA